MTVVAFALLFAAAALAVAWPLLRQQRPAAVPAEAPPDPRDDLVRQKAELYAQIRDLDFDYEAGGIAEGDYRASRATLEGAAAGTLEALEALGVPAAPRPAGRPDRAPVPARPSRGLRLALLLGGVLSLGLALGYFLATSVGPRGSDDSPTGTVGGLTMSGSAPGAGATPLTEARALVERGEMGKAFEIYRAILEQDPRNVEAITQLGVILARGRSFDEAHLAFDRALGIDPHAPLPLWEKGLAYFQAGRPRDGVRVWERLIAVAPTDERAAMARQMIARVRESMGRPSGSGGSPR